MNLIQLRIPPEVKAANEANLNVISSGLMGSSVRPEGEGPYDVIFNDVRSAIKSLTAMTEEDLEDVGSYVVEETRCLGGNCCQRFEKVAKVLHQAAKSLGRKRTLPGGITLAQYFMAWAWAENERADYYLNYCNVYDDDDPYAMLMGVDSAMIAAQALSHAKALLASDASKSGRKVAKR